MTFSRCEVATRLSENVPYVDLDGGDVVLSGCETLGGKKRRHGTSEVQTLYVNEVFDCSAS